MDLSSIYLFTIDKKKHAVMPVRDALGTLSYIQG